MFKIFPKPVLLFLAAAPLASFLPFPSLAFVGPPGWVQEVTAEVMPTPDQVQKELAQLSEMVQNAESVTVISPTVEREYIEAKNAFRTGNFLGALKHADSAERALQKVPPSGDSKRAVR